MYCRRRPLSYPVPWLTFGATRAIRSTLYRGSFVFEYGAGHSTLFWAKQGAKVHAVESDPTWYQLLDERLARDTGMDVDLYLRGNKEDYINTICQLEHDSFDVIIVDGLYRRDCVATAVPYLKRGGCLVVDNTDWHEFTKRPLEMIPAGWKKSVFPGYAPMLGHQSETTVWTRPR